MADKLSAANHDAKEYGTFSNAQETCVENNEKQQVLESYLYRGSRGIPCRFEVDRDAMTQVLLDNISPPLEGTGSFPQKVHTAFKNKFLVSCSCINNTLKTAFPILRWLPDYSIKNDLFLDILTGITLLILHVPQGMAYAQLASVSPIYGLYTSFYPVLIYIFLGTSKHVSIGTFAISSLLAGTEVDFISQQENLTHKIAQDHLVAMNVTQNSTLYADLPVVHDNIQIAMILTFMVGTLQTIMDCVVWDT
ncbi:prestin [Trichonephila clavata]|uniref:Prestin n=1 Tax=Trichonephila clavata TaxID=2740835 RepID=A0A8X6IMC8_TRICU|nr:prestin [Trichonephila clavata]